MQRDRGDSGQDSAQAQAEDDLAKAHRASEHGISLTLVGRNSGAISSTLWLAGTEKHEALKQAQLEMRERVKRSNYHDLPYYWGAFVLVGR
jgi:hypothetical protein